MHHCNDIRQHLAAHFFLSPFPKSGPPAAPVRRPNIAMARRCYRRFHHRLHPARAGGHLRPLAQHRRRHRRQRSARQDILDAVRRKFPYA